MKKIFMTFLASAIGLCSAGACQAATYNFELGHSGTADHHFQAISLQFAERVAQLTNSEVKITVIPDGALGNHIALTTDVIVNTRDMCLTSDATLSYWVKDLAVLNLPYLFDSNRQYRQIIDGPVGEQLTRRVTELGPVVIGWWENGLRHITNSEHEIKTPADLKSLLIRIPEGDIFQEMFTTLGTEPLVLSIEDLPNMLEAGVVKAQENPPARILTQKLYTTQKYVSRTGHVHMGTPVLMSRSAFEQLPEKYRKAILQAGREMGPIHTRMVDEQEAAQWKALADHGMKITDVDKMLFRQAVQPAFDRYKATIDPELFQVVMKTLGRQ